MAASGRWTALPWAGPGALALLCALACAATAEAARSVVFAIEDADGGQWAASGIEVQLDLGVAGPLSLSARIDRLRLPPPVGEIDGIRLECPALQIGAQAITCARVAVSLAASPLDASPFSADVRYEPAGKRLSVSSKDAPVRGERIAFDAFWNPARWSVRLAGNTIPTQRIYPLLAEILGALPPMDIATGTTSFNIQANSSATGLPGVDVTLALDDVALANGDGTLATEGVSANIGLTLEPGASAQPDRFRVSLRAARGEAYLEPAYFDLAKRPLEIVAQGQLDRPAKTFTLAPLTYAHTGALRAEVTGRFAWHERIAIRDAELQLDKASLPAAYATYLQGFLVGTPLAKLQTTGSASGRFAFADDRLVAADLDLSGVSVDDTEQRVALYGLDGDLHWRRTGPAQQTRLDWDGGFVYDIGYGGGSTRLTIGPGRVALVDALRVPVLDGALVIDTFDARKLRTEHPEFDLDARLEPIGLRRLTAAFGWPAFPGALSGELPMLSLRDGVVTLGGSLVVRAFDGTARVSNLRVEEPFGSRRRGSADVAIDNIDLAQLTDVFSLGRIEGRLDARIEGLRTLRSEPVAFDARFYTSPGDRSRHRISRRALSNISEIAGGTALLASGFLAFFEQFSYRELGVSCKLQRDVCLMGGIAPAENGYYIVKGKGLPRIDVIGHSREVNWPQLVAQITEALKSQDVSTGKPSENAQ